MRLAVLLNAMFLAGHANLALAFEAQTGLDILRSPDTTIESLHRLYVGQTLGNGLSFGQSIYSAASGDAGGAFFWGYEAVKAWPVGSKVSIFAQGFLGGGGGAAQVDGDGLMMRLGLGLAVAMNDRLSLKFGVSRLAIDGGDEAATAVGVGLGYSTAPDISLEEGLQIRSVALRAGQMRLDGSTRSGSEQPTLSVVGAEFAFLGGPLGEWWLQADGAAGGGDGYMQVTSGVRHRTVAGGVPIYAEAGIGLAGGGDVDTGGGAFMRAGVGANVPLTRAVDLDVSLSRVWMVDAGSTGVIASAGLVRVFHRGASDDADGAAQDWIFSTGVSQQLPGEGFRKDPTSSDGRPLMQETALDLLISDDAYVTGNAQTVLAGDAAGYAIGLVGLGWKGTLTKRIGWAVEVHLGAAGGGGVAVGRGALGSLRGEIDYRIKDELWASIAFGRMRSLDGDGMAPQFITVGLKHPLRTQ